MRARKEKDGLWIVTEGRRWWTVHIKNSGAAYICNEHLTVIRPHGALGKRIISAVAAAQALSRRR